MIWSTQLPGIVGSRVDFFQYRCDFRYPERVRKVTSTQRLVEENNEEWCELIGEFLDQPGWSWIETTRLIRSPSDQIFNVVDG